VEQTGRVVDLWSGGPVAGVTVLLTGESLMSGPYYHPPDRAARATSRRDGSFSFKGVIPGRRYFLIPTGDRWVRQMGKAIYVGHQGPVPRTIVVSQGQPISGVVKAPDGVLVAGVHIVADQNGSFPYGETDSDARGRFRIEHLPPGKIHLVAHLWKPDLGNLRGEVDAVVGSRSVVIVLKPPAWRSGADPGAGRPEPAGTPEPADLLLWRALSDGQLSAQEQAEAAQALKAQRCYAVLVQFRSSSQRPAPRFPSVVGAEAEGLRVLERVLKDNPGLRPVRINLWHEPSPETQSKCEGLAKRALQRIYDDLAAAKARFPELAKFDKEHVRVRGTEIWYNSEIPPRLPKRIPEPKVDISIRIEPPYFADAQPEPAARLFLPKQKLAVIRRVVGVQDERLKEFIKETVDKAVQPLVALEKGLRSQPVPEHGSW